MAQTQPEILEITASLRLIVRNSTDDQGIPIRPTGHEWSELTTLMSRLLQLRGFTEPGVRPPEDLWALILEEFGPPNVPCSSSLSSDSKDSSRPRSILLRPEDGVAVQVPEGVHVRFEDVSVGRARRVGSISRSFT
ncbi:hypothetical protein BBP40_004656 [Aspergillus hancockii]|nr:hypothetical protein BBP40_004656 [Aspergillus hancockii]